MQATQAGGFPRAADLQARREADDILGHLSLPGGAIDEVAPLAKSFTAIYHKYWVGHRLSRFQTGPDVTVTYADATAYEKAQALFPHYQELARLFTAKSNSREMVIDLDL